MKSLVCYGWQENKMVAVSNFYRELIIPAFFLGVSASKESIRESQIKMVTLKEAL